MTITKSDKKMFTAARKVAMESDFDSFHMGCVIVYKHHIIGAASNSDKTHPMQARYNEYRKFNKTKNGIKHSLHAEIAALATVPYPLGIDVEWKNVKVYIYRIAPGRQKGFGLARPCPGCRKALKDLGIRHIYYTGNEGNLIYEQLY